jgi:hypothetical protein
MLNIEGVDDVLRLYYPFLDQDLSDMARIAISLLLDRGVDFAHLGCASLDEDLAQVRDWLFNRILSRFGVPRRRFQCSPGGMRLEQPSQLR